MCVLGIGIGVTETLQSTDEGKVKHACQAFCLICQLFQHLGGGRRPPLSESPPVVTARRRRFKLAWANSEPNAHNIVAEGEAARVCSTKINFCGRTSV